MENSLETSYTIIIDGFTYFVHEQEKDKFFVTHEIPHSPVSSLLETGIFVISSNKFWHVEGVSEINETHRIKIFQVIETLLYATARPTGEIGSNCGLY
jgi:hypothetical protein